MDSFYPMDFHKRYFNQFFLKVHFNKELQRKKTKHTKRITNLAKSGLDYSINSLCKSSRDLKNTKIQNSEFLFISRGLKFQFK